MLIYNLFTKYRPITSQRHLYFVFQKYLASKLDEDVAQIDAP